MIANLYTRVKNKVTYFFRPKALALSYHRIADVDVDSWELAVSPKNFEEQLQVLKKYQLISASELVAHLNKGTIKQGMICITFDDGYQDNYWHAKPLLEQYEAPATVFVATGYTDQKQRFWWDELHFILLGPHGLPETLRIKVRSNLIEFNLGKDATLEAYNLKTFSSWKWYEPAHNKRMELYLLLWQYLRPLPTHEITELVNQLSSWAMVRANVSKLDCPMTNEMLFDLCTTRLWDLGIHTVSHPALAYHTKEVQHAEILDNKRTLENLAQRNIDLIAYPYGVYNSETVAVCKQLNLKGGFTTKGVPVFKEENPFEIGRMHAKNWNGEEFEKQLNTWFKGINI